METEVLYSETQTAQKTWVLAVILVAFLVIRRIKKRRSKRERP